MGVVVGAYCINAGVLDDEALNDDKGRVAYIKVRPSARATERTRGGGARVQDGAAAVLSHDGDRAAGSARGAIQSVSP